MSAPDDSYRTAPTGELIDDLLDNRPEVYQKAKMELLARLANTKKNTSCGCPLWVRVLVREYFTCRYRPEPGTIVGSLRMPQ
jgi:hypothetical protein